VQGNGCTGIYESGSDTVIMRMSDVNFLYEGAIGHTPSIALKFLIDKKESENIFAQYNLLPGDSHNFFTETISNRIFTVGRDFEEGETNDTTDILMSTAVKKMVEGSRRPFALGVSNIADKDNSGKRIGRRSVKTPFELRFIAPDRIRDRFEDEQSEAPWYEELRDRISSGEVIYEVYAHTPEYDGGPGEEEEVKIADVILRSDLYTSEWADKKLFFKHEHVHPDRKFWPVGL